MSDSVLQRIRDMLVQEGVSFREVHHGPTHSSEESAKARGEELRVGGKALLLCSESTFRLFVFSAARKMDSHAVRTHFGVHHLRFASKEELMELTGLVPGCVPPFGKPILPFDLYADESVFQNDRIAFNAGSLTDSIIMPIADYRRLARPTVFSFTRASE